MKQIVFADDDIFLLDLYKEFFSDLDLQKHFASDFNSLISICEKSQIDVVIMDTLDRAYCIDTVLYDRIKKLKETNLNINIFIITGDIRIRIIKENVITLHKPIDLKLVENFIKGVSNG